MPCRENDCPAFEMIGWPVPPDRCTLEATVGMVDTTVNRSHPALRGQPVEVVRIIEERDRPAGAVHGTAIAALLVGADQSTTPGLLPRAKLVAVEAFHRDRTGDAADVYKIVRGIDVLSERGIRIVNLSFAGPPNALLERAAERALEEGAVLIAAAGNGGPKSPPAYPAGYDGVIAVTAVDRKGKVFRQAGRGAHIAFAAPGVGVWTAASVSGGRYRSGTSYAVPFVTAAIAATLAERPGLSAADAAAELAARSDDLGLAGRDPVFGWGLVRPPRCGSGAATASGR